jgi:hypothetical protein
VTRREICLMASAIAAARPRPSLREKFMAKAHPEPNTGCWLWTGALTKGGYGKMGVDGVTTDAHRLSWELHRGDTGGHFVLHRCDIRCCVNPDHLFLGTHADNMLDMVAKGRGTRSRLLTDADIVGIRQAVALGEVSRRVAERYGISAAYVCKIVKGKNVRTLT